MAHELVAKADTELERMRAAMRHARTVKYSPERLIRIFWAQVIVSPAGCWVWTGAVDPNGYGRVRRNRRTMLVHRYVWSELVGPLPKGRLILCHTCDNPPCCNPEHLYLGTSADNMRDLLDRHPERAGIPHPTKLTADDVRQIRSEFGTVSAATLARRYGVSKGHILAIGKRERGGWAWLDA